MAKTVTRKDNKFAWNLKDLKITKKGQLTNEEKFAWVFEDLINVPERLDESAASQAAHKMGLKFAGWGKWKDPQTGKVTHKSVGDKLVPIGHIAPKGDTGSYSEQPAKQAAPVEKVVPKFEKPTDGIDETSKHHWDKLTYLGSSEENEANAYYEQKFLKDDDFAKFAKGLDSKEVSAVRHYSENGYQAINKFLRKGEGDEAYSKKYIERIDAAFAAAPRTKNAMVLWRGISSGSLTQKLLPIIKANLTKGTEFEDAGFVSTSILKRRAEGFGEGLVFSIKVPVGSKGVLPLELTSESGNELTSHHSEKEVLLRRGSKFRVLKYITEETKGYGGDTNTRIRVELEYLGSPTAGGAPKKQSAADVAFAAAGISKEPEKTAQKDLGNIIGLPTVDPKTGSVSPGKVPAEKKTWADTLTFVKPLGGTQGSKVYKSPKGKYYAVKGEDYSGDVKWNNARVGAEKLANNIYERLGFGAPWSRVENRNGKRVLVTEFMKNLEKVDPNNPEMKKQVADGFAVDLWLGNRDVVGLEMDNVMWNPQTQKVYRLDNGAAFQFRAQGKEKPFDVDTLWAEFKGLRDPNKNPNAAKFFGHLDDKTVAEQVRDKIKPLDDTVLEGLVEGQNIPTKEKQKIINGLIFRKKALVDWADNYLATAAPLQEYFDQFRLS